MLEDIALNYLDLSFNTITEMSSKKEQTFSLI